MVIEKDDDLLLPQRTIHRPLIVIFMMLALHVFLLFSSTVLIGLIFGFQIIAENYYIIFIKNFILTALLWLWIFPQVIGMPFGKLSFRKYIKLIKLSYSENFGKNTLMALLCAFIFLASMFCSSLFLGESQIYLENIIPPNSWILLIAISPGLWEELIYRGVFLTLLLKRFSQNKAIFYDSLIFAIMHAFNLIFSDLSYQAFLFVGAQIVYTFFAGLFLGYLFVKTNSLIPGIIVHYLVDALGPIFVYPDTVSIEIILAITILTVGILPAVICILIIKYTYSLSSNPKKS